MAPKIFITGSTGYIGGDAFFAIATAHQDYEITCLVRNTDKAASIAAVFPKVRFVYGDLDKTALVQEESEKADIVLSCASADHPSSIQAMIRGLATRSPTPGFLVHTSGTGILMYEDIVANRRGTRLSDKVYDDWDAVAEVTSLPDEAPHRKVDRIALAAEEQGVKVAVVCPPTIYGACRGPAGARGHQVYELARVTMQHGHGVRVNEGLAYWTNVHVHDLSDVYLRLIEEAFKGGGAATWGPQGYYFTEHGEHVWGDVAASVAEEAAKQGFIHEAKVVSVNPEEADRLTPYGSFLWGGNSRGKAIRARKVLGWRPHRQGMMDSLPEIVKEEAERLGLVQHHAQVAAVGAS